MGIGWSITSTMIGGMATLGFIGYLIGRLVGAQRVLTGIGFVVGAALAIYSIALRYGGDEGGGG
jgi:hypothetical protein